MPWVFWPSFRCNRGGRLGIELPTPDDLARAFLVPTYDVKWLDSGSPIDQSFRTYRTGWNRTDGGARTHHRVRRDGLPKALEVVEFGYGPHQPLTASPR